jgi:hypothetical protein
LSEGEKFEEFEEVKGGSNLNIKPNEEIKEGCIEQMKGRALI